MRLTNDKTAEDLRRINDMLRKVNTELINPSDERYVKLADYERIVETPEELREYIGRLTDRKPGKWIANKRNASSKCNKCKRVFVDETPYRPNCGAKMDESGGE